MISFIRGIAFIFVGLQLIVKPGLKRYVLIPLILNILIFSILFLVLKYFFAEFNTWFNHFLPVWLHWLSAVLWVVFILSFFFAIMYTFTAVGNILCAPFNSLLSEKVETYLTGVVPQEVSLLAGIKDAPRSMARQMATLAYYVPRAIIMLILFIVPLVQVAAPFVWLAFNAWYIALMYVDYPTDNHRIAFGDARRWMAQRRMESFGLGAGILVISLIPIINLLAIPVAVAAATAFWVKNNAPLR